MKKIKVIVNGLPGKMAWAVTEAIINSEKFELLPIGLTGPEIMINTIVVSGTPVRLLDPDHKTSLWDEGLPDVIIDFTTPSAINDNVDFYSVCKVPFVLGTTSGDLKYIQKRVQEDAITAVVAPNMAKEIVAFQAMMEFAAENFPGVFKDYDPTIIESHQKTKVDTSGTAKSLVASFNKLGASITVEQIDKKRTEADYEAMGIPPEYWAGHGWHTYSLNKKDESVFFSFTHNVNGRQAYIDGTLDAASFLFNASCYAMNHGKVFSMIDVLRNSEMV
jgi:4-hydroxy-tetrahydrodipicolinate reductase